MGEDYPFGYTGMRVGPSVERARMVQQRRDYQRSGGYGVAPSGFPSYAYSSPILSGNGEILVNPNTRYVDLAGPTDRFGGFEMEPGLMATNMLPQAQAGSTPSMAQAPTPAPVQGGLMPTGTMLGNSEAVAPLSMTPREMAAPILLAGQELPQVQAPTSVAGDVGNFFKSKQGGALLAAGGGLLASGVLGGRPDESPITDRIKELEGTEQYGRFLDIASRTAPSRADYLGVMAARGGSAVQAEEAAQAAQSRAAREAVSEYNRYRVAADAQAAELRLALQQQREQRRLARIQGFGAALGTAAGFLLAGPTGAQIGGALGSGAGSVLGDLTN